MSEKGSMDDAKKRQEQLDDFWKLDDLMPKETRRSPSSARRDIDTVEVEVPAGARQTSQTVIFSAPLTNARGESGAGAFTCFVPPHRPNELRPEGEPENNYSPSGCLIRRVEVYPWASHYDYYATFAQDAVAIESKKVVDAPRVSFYSYMPQYSQLNARQLAWYLWWRKNIREGKYLETDPSYVMLLMFELINIDDGDPMVRRDTMCDLWKHYRFSSPSFDKLFGDWICDFSLIHQLPPPTHLLTGESADLLRDCALKEYFLDGNNRLPDVGNMLAFCSNYDYRSSKYYNDETKELYKTVVYGSLEIALDCVFSEENASSMQDHILVKDAFVGAICTSKNKKKLVVTFRSFSRSHDLRFLVTDTVKFAENAMRAHLGVRSRLTIYYLPVEVREKLEAYYGEILPRPEKIKRGKTREEEEAEARLAYEKKYDPPRVALSSDIAGKIEEESWQTTQTLISAFEDADGGEEKMTGDLPPDSTTESIVESNLSKETACGTDRENEKNESFSSRLGNLLPFLQAALNADVGREKELAKESGKSLDWMADSVNEIAVEYFGDIILEEDGGYRIIEDYTEEVKEMLQNG